MHPKNPFNKDYDFDALTKQFAPLKKHVFVNEYGTKTIKFGDQDAVRALNTALLRYRYQIQWHIPNGYLCPPIPGRLDYLLHVADLLAPKKNIRMLDIGTGANLIYPILATAHFKWRCTASEVEQSSLDHARRIIEKNPSLARTRLRIQFFRNKIFETVIREDDQFEVVVCNPPFYKSKEDAVKKNQRKAKNLGLDEKEATSFAGFSNELWVKGGEVAFIKRMAKESVQFKDQVLWFTALIARKDNVASIEHAIKRMKPTQVKIVDMGQGNKVSRFIAWTFQDVTK